MPLMAPGFPRKPPHTIPFCDNWVLSPLRTHLELLIVPALLLAYLPQCIKFSRYGTTGISPEGILLLCLFSSTQLASRIVNPEGSHAFDCVFTQDQLHGSQAFGALLGYIEVLTQWLCAMLLLQFFVRFRSPMGKILAIQLQPTTEDVRSDLVNEPLGDTLTTTSTSEMSSHCLSIVIVSHAVISIGIAFYMLRAPSMSSDFHRLLPLILREFYHWICIVMGSFLTTALCVLQIRDAKVGHGTGRISLLSLALQVVVLLALALLQAFRPTYPGEAWKTPRSWQWYAQDGNVSVNYFVMAAGQAVALALRVKNSLHASGGSRREC